MSNAARSRKSLVVVVSVVGLTFASRHLARADRIETKAIKADPIPLETHHITCVLKLASMMEVPTSFGDKPARVAKVWIETSPKGNPDMDHETLDLLIQPKTTYRNETYAYSVSDGRVQVTHLYPTAEGIRSQQDVYQNTKEERGLSFRTDSKGHLALSGQGEQISLDFGTGILLRVWGTGEHFFSAHTEAYACKPNLL